MVDTSLAQAQHAGRETFSDSVALFLAIHRHDATAVGALLARRPELVEQHEDWAAAEAHRARLPYAREGTPLIRAAERGELDVVELLLDAGADVDGACGCSAGETPLWAAAAADYPQVVAYLLQRGADPNAPGPRGHTALHLAAMRGWAQLAQTLLAGGADPLRTDEAGNTPLDWALRKGHAELVALLRTAQTAPAAPGASPATTRIVAPPAPAPPSVASDAGAGDPGRLATPADDLCETGIKVIDLFLPLRHGDLVLVDGDSGRGLVVLLSELTLAMRERGYRQALWTGFEQPLLNCRQLEHALGESGQRARVRLALVPAELGAAAAREAFRRILRGPHQDRGRAAGPQLYVIFEAEGHEAAVESALPHLTRRGLAPTTAIVVLPEVFPPPEDAGAPAAPLPAALPPGAASHLRFDGARARRGLYPAVDAVHSVSAHRTADVVGAEHAAVAEAARELLVDYRRIDPQLDFPEPGSVPAGHRTTAIRAQRLHAFLSQPFVFAEPFTGLPGARVPRAATVRGAKLILQGAADALPLERLKYAGDLRPLLETAPPA
ncbi:MAG TPA: ankyrin repeat domain-containing protein [Chloroflexota bacterium]|nr:ankyrin repeat domain-containing protein [Chloroflexota bacterium]